MSSPYDALLDPPKQTSPYDALLTPPAPKSNPYDALLAASREQGHKETVARTSAPLPEGRQADLFEKLITANNPTIALMEAILPKTVVEAGRATVQDPIASAGVVKKTLETVNKYTDPIGIAIREIAPDSALAKVDKGLVTGTANIVSSMTSPENIAMIGMGGVSKVATKLIGGYFATQAARQFPEQTKEFMATTDPEKKAAIATEMLGGLVIAGGFLHEGFTGLKKGIVPKEAVDATKTAVDTVVSGQKQQRAIDAKMPLTAETIKAGEQTTATPIEPVDKEKQLKVSPDETQPAGKPEFAVGAASPLEFPAQKTTGLAKAVVKDERLARGVEDLPKPERKSNEITVQRAEDRSASDPKAVQKLIGRILDEGKRSITDDEAADLLVERNRLMNERRGLEKEWYDPETTEERKADATKSLEDIENQIERLDRAQRAGGSSTGSALQMFQRLIKEDYTLEAIENRRRIAKNGPLTEQERATIKEQADQIAELQKRVEASEGVEQKAKDQEALTAAYESTIKQLKDEAAAQPRFDKRILDVAEKIVTKLESNAEVASKRLREKLGRMSAGVDPTILKDVSEILAAKIARGGFEFADASSHLIEEYGNKIIPYIRKGWAEAQKLIYKTTAEPKVREAVSKGVRKGEKTTGDILAKAKAEATAGEELSHQTVYELARAHIKAGIHGEDEVMKAVHDDIKQAYPEATERDVRRAFSEYGKVKFPSKDADLKELRELRTLTRLQESIDRLKSNQDALHSGLQRDKASQTIREKQAQLNELLKQRQGLPSPEKLASRDEAKQTALRNAITDIDKQLRTGEKTSKGESIPDSPKTEQLRSERDAMKAKLDEIEREANPKLSPEERYNAMRQKAIAKQLADVQERIKKGDYSKPVKKPTPIKNPETVRAWTDLQKAKAELKADDEKAKYESRSGPQKLVDTMIKKPWHFLTAIKTMGHGTVGMITHAGGLLWRPSKAEIYWRNFGRQFGMWANPAYHERLIYNLEKHPRYDFWKDAGASIDPQKTYTDYGLYAKWMGKAAAGGARGFDALKLTRLELNEADWKNVPSDIKNDPVSSKETAKQIAAINNQATGAIPKGNDALLNTLARSKVAEYGLFAPKLYASRWTRVVLDPVKTAFTFADWKNASPADRIAAKLRAKHAGEFAATYLGALITNQAILAATGSNQKVNFTDPKKGDWLKFKVGGKEIIADGGLLDPIRLIGQILWGDLIQNRTANERYQQGTRYEKVTHDLMNYVRGKFNPALGLIVDTTTQSDFSGRPLPYSNEPGKYKDQPKYEWGEWLAQQGPIPLSGGVKIAYDAMREKGLSHLQAMDIIKGAGIAATGMTGAHVLTDYSAEPKSTKTKTSRTSKRGR